jgi:hypothetical protein
LPSGGLTIPPSVLQRAGELIDRISLFVLSPGIRLEDLVPEQVATDQAHRASNDGPQRGVAAYRTEGGTYASTTRAAHQGAFLSGGEASTSGDGQERHGQ